MGMSIQFAMAQTVAREILKNPYRHTPAVVEAAQWVVRPTEGDYWNRPENSVRYGKDSTFWLTLKRLLPKNPEDWKKFLYGGKQ